VAQQTAACADETTHATCDTKATARCATGAACRSRTPKPRRSGAGRGQPVGRSDRRLSNPRPTATIMTVGPGTVPRSIPLLWMCLQVARTCASATRRLKRTTVILVLLCASTATQISLTLSFSLKPACSARESGLRGGGRAAQYVAVVANGCTSRHSGLSTSVSCTAWRPHPVCRYGSSSPSSLSPDGLPRSSSRFLSHQAMRLAISRSKPNCPGS
jgi:hypothetical protein